MRMKTTLVIFGYLKWHYTRAIYSLSQIWGNFIYFVAEFFSLKLLFTNFFDPWKRMSDRYPNNFNIKEYFYAFMTNTIVRMVGITMRSFLIVIGLTCYFATILFYPLVIMIWLTLPFIITALVTMGIIIILR